MREKVIATEPIVPHTEAIRELIAPDSTPRREIAFCLRETSPRDRTGRHR